VPGPIDEFCESLRSDLHARRVKARAELERLHQLVDELGLAREAALVAAFASSVNLRVPVYKGATPATIHARLAAAVEALTEARSSGHPSPPVPANATVPSAVVSAPSSLFSTPALPTTPSRVPTAVPTPSPAATSAPQPSEPGSVGTPRWPTLERLVGDAPIVVVGGSRGEKLAWLPSSLRAKVEWIETTRQGTHAIGNLAQRIRQRRVLALIVLDGVVGHKHSEPLVTAAREVKIPTAYANKGGTGALARAFTQLEKMVGAP
jgi:hypothetical protein